MYSNTDIRWLLKILKEKMVMFSTVLNLNGIFRGIGKTIKGKIY